MTDDDDFAKRDAVYPVAPLERVELRLSEPRDGEELPLRLLVLNDLGRKPAAEERWRSAELTKETFDHAVFGDGVELELTVPNHIDEGGPPLAVHLHIHKLSDLEPEAVVRSQPEMRRLLEIRRALTAIKGPIGGEKAMRLRLLRMVADPETRTLFAAGFGAEATVATIPAYLERVAAMRDEAASSCDPARLSELAHNGDDVIAGRVAQNPATPRVCLQSLSRRFPEEVARNPAVMQACRDDPESGRDLAPACARREFAGGAIDVALLEAWGRSSDTTLRAAAAGCPASPAELLELLARDASREVAAAVSENPNASSAALRWLATRWDPESAAARRTIASNPRTPQDLLAHLTADLDDDVRAGVAANPTAPASLLTTLASDAHWKVRRAVAGSAAASRELLLGMLDDDDGNVREAVAGHLVLHSADVEGLATDRHLGVRLALVRRADAGPELLRLLAIDPDERVRLEAVCHPNARRAPG